LVRISYHMSAQCQGSFLPLLIGAGGGGRTHMPGKGRCVAFADDRARHATQARRGLPALGPGSTPDSFTLPADVDHARRLVRPRGGFDALPVPQPVATSRRAIVEYLVGGQGLRDLRLPGGRAMAAGDHGVGDAVLPQHLANRGRAFRTFDGAARRDQIGDI